MIIDSTDVVLSDHFGCVGRICTVVDELSRREIDRFPISDIYRYLTVELNVYRKISSELLSSAFVALEVLVKTAFSHILESESQLLTEIIRLYEFFRGPILRKVV